MVLMVVAVTGSDVASVVLAATTRGWPKAEASVSDELVASWSAPSPSLSLGPSVLVITPSYTEWLF